MTDRPFHLLLIAGLLTVPGNAVAQSQAPVDDRWPAATQQMEQRAPQATENAAPSAAPAAPAPAARPARRARTQTPAATAPTATAAAPAVTAPRRAAARGKTTAHTIACSGPFARDSSQLGLATAFDSKNVTFTEVDGPEGSKLKASVLFPNDPKQRLEVLWRDDEARRGISLIVVNAQSTWTGPKGLKLGLGLAALEKLNGKPFRLKGLDQDNPGAVMDWQGGALDSLPGGCTVGLRLVPDPKATDAARAEANGKEFLSSDASVKAIKPIVAEILFGYPDEQ